MHEHILKRDIAKKLDDTSLENLVFEVVHRKGVEYLRLTNLKSDISIKQLVQKHAKESIDALEVIQAERARKSQRLLKELLKGSKVEFHNIPEKRYLSKDELRKGYVLLQPKDKISIE